LTRDILACAIEVHRELGPGLLENIYNVCLQHELAASGIAFRAEVPIPVRYRERKLDAGFRADLLIQEQVLVELKALDQLLPIHDAQLLTYLRFSRIRVGLLINFNVRVLKDGIRRRVN
jgi:GxxExxY protein